MAIARRAGVVLLLLLSWGGLSSPAHGAAEQVKVTLQYHGYWGLVTPPGGICPAAPPGTDTLTGVVTKQSEDEDGVTYKGTLARVTDIGLCEVQDTADGHKWCGGELHGHGDVDVVIVVPAAGNDSESLLIELKPVPSMTVTVGGNCSTLDNGTLAQQYKSHDTILFETSDVSSTGGVRVPPTGGLFPRADLYFQTRRIGDGYTLKVDRP
jgi:hypothetical protein